MDFVMDNLCSVLLQFECNLHLMMTICAPFQLTFELSAPTVCVCVSSSAFDMRDGKIIINSSKRMLKSPTDCLL